MRDASGARPALADEDANGGGFARAVRAEQPEQFAAADVEVQPVDGRERAVQHAQARDANHGVGWHQEFTAETAETAEKDKTEERIEQDFARVSSLILVFLRGLCGLRGESSYSVAAQLV